MKGESLVALEPSCALGRSALGLGEGGGDDRVCQGPKSPSQVEMRGQRGVDECQQLPFDFITLLLSIKTSGGSFVRNFSKSRSLCKPCLI